MIGLGSMTILERLLRRVIDYGIQRISVVIAATDRVTDDHVESLRRDLPANLEISIEREAEPCGNAGALGVVAFSSHPVLLCFGDLVTRIDFGRFVDVHRDRGCDVTLASHFEYHQLTFGELVSAADEVQLYLEKPRKQFLMCSGMALFQASAIQVARTLPQPFGLADLVNAVIERGGRVTHWEHGSYWIDVNTADSLESARRDLAEDDELVHLPAT
jgi:NDP-sugar pyrophosphorylase family protein